MKHITLSILLLLISSISAPAQLLWKVSGNHLSKPSYLLGSHHLAPNSFCDSIKGFDDAIKSCDEVYGEIKKEELNTISMGNYIVAPEDSTMKKLLTADQYALADSIFKKYSKQAGMMDNFNQLKPAMASNLLEIMRDATEFPNFDPNKGIDFEVQTKGAKLGKPVKGLETPDFQMNLLFGNPISEQLSAFIESIENDELDTQMGIDISRAYLRQDISTILKVMEDTRLTTKEDLERLLYSRNRNWAAQLKNLMPQKSMFVCVGAAHLPGHYGLLELLRKAGFKVEAVR